MYDNNGYSDSANVIVGNYR